ncbi:MAG: Gfo/Idh/MocA family protein, partial [Terriglobia bacterium]
MSKLGVAVIGVGVLGKRHAENLRRAIPEAQLVAVADSDLKRASQVAAELEVEHYSENPEVILARKDVQAVVIASPSKFHAGLI